MEYPTIQALANDPNKLRIPRAIAQPLNVEAIGNSSNTFGPRETSIISLKTESWRGSTGRFSRQYARIREIFKVSQGLV
ncbi:hypothetical protein KR51_00015830 [Rubidibacter lacunae KORDI 51-2]|uniref:Uncharacterized protein n=1 Tax=Rubidibacter lacunae KORDI 51-2 TaxID=582515 RepID=U5DJ72_9CHRO|nr:hypothetical protein [Rubidibacter lacunae]ERN41736.1 hypothetical protein KR51_00015830 [Rubidibacter lacunae KORDI 51-2]